ncbi:MAG TPA: VWA domain-containing protein [Flavilitoribacter sp.]|nr:VWA domain-containing protein [Flavilitoribacter sp.]HMQ86008.1 VWA domain-containing protein [Flavilitoribacter sp.]
MKKGLFLSVLCLWLSAGFGQATITAALDSSRILIGDQVRLHFDISLDKNAKLFDIGFSVIDSVKGLEVLDSTNLLQTPSQNDQLFSKDFRLTSFDSGYYRIPPVIVQYLYNGDTSRVQSNELALQVRTIPVESDTTGVMPIKPILTEPVKFRDFLPYLIIGIAGLLIGLTVFLIIYNSRRQKMKLPPPLPPPHEIALGKLHNLEKAQLWQKGELKNYYSQLTYIIREYVEGRFKVPAPELTTEETLAQLQKQALSNDRMDAVSRLLQSADLVKFAKAEPGVSLHTEFLKDAVDFVQATKEEAVPMPEQPAGQQPPADNAFLPLVVIGGWQFAYPWLLLLLLLLPVLAWLYSRNYRNRYSNIRIPSLSGLNGATIRTKLRPFLTVLRALAFILLVIALARPQKMLKEENITAEGIDIALAMDLSSSMLAQDFQPNRLEVSKRVARDFVDKRPYDRIGLVVFAGEAYTQCPLTTDHSILDFFLAKLECGLLKDGTAIGMGLATAVNRLQDSKAKSKVVILLTDGVNNTGYQSPELAARMAKELGIRVYTIGVGSVGETLIPVSRSNDGRYIFDIARVEIDEQLLNEIADMTGGKYFRARDAESLERIYESIDALEKTKVDVTVIKRYSEEYHYFMFWGLLFLMIELVLRYTWLRSAP